MPNRPDSDLAIDIGRAVSLRGRMDSFIARKMEFSIYELSFDNIMFTGVSDEADLFLTELLNSPTTRQEWLAEGDFYDHESRPETGI